MNALRLGPKFWYIAHLRMTTEIAKFSDCKKLNLTKCGWNFLLVMPRYKRFFIAMAVVSKFYLQNFYTKKKTKFKFSILRNDFALFHRRRDVFSFSNSIGTNMTVRNACKSDDCKRRNASLFTYVYICIYTCRYTEIKKK